MIDLHDCTSSVHGFNVIHSWYVFLLKTHILAMLTVAVFTWWNNPRFPQEKPFMVFCNFADCLSSSIGGTKCKRNWALTRNCYVCVAKLFCLSNSLLIPHILHTAPIVVYWRITSNDCYYCNLMLIQTHFQSLLVSNIVLKICQILSIFVKI